LSADSLNVETKQRRWIRSAAGVSTLRWLLGSFFVVSVPSFIMALQPIVQAQDTSMRHDFWTLSRLYLYLWFGPFLFLYSPFPAARIYFSIFFFTVLVLVACAFRTRIPFVRAVLLTFAAALWFFASVGEFLIEVF
jgi:hypothetical protein